MMVRVQVMEALAESREMHLEEGDSINPQQVSGLKRHRQSTTPNLLRGTGTTMVHGSDHTHQQLQHQRQQSPRYRHKFVENGLLSPDMLKDSGGGPRGLHLHGN